MKYLTLLLVLLLVGCSLMQNYSVSEQEYFDRATSIPTIFWLTPFEVEAAWQRAGEFVSRFASFPIANMNDYIISCQKPASDVIWGYGYRITKMRTGENYRIEVSCFSNSKFFTKKERQNEHFAAYFIRNNVLMSSIIHQ